MKTITLHTASVDNAGRYLSAGNRVEVGSAPGQIALDRARGLVADASAIDATPSARKTARSK